MANGEPTHLHKEEAWDLVVASKKKLFDVNLKDIWDYRYLIAMFVRRDFVSLYKQTILGPLWLLIQPLLTTIIFLFIFSNIAHISTDGIHGTLFYLSGLTVWNYFATCLNKTAGTFTNNSNLFGKVYFPRLTLPISIIISGMFTFFIQFVLFILVLIYFILFKQQAFTFSPYLLLIPYLVVLMGFLGLGLGIIISSLTIKYRDLSYLITFGVQLLMFFSPVIIPLSIVSGTKKILFELNPMSSIIESFRYAFFPVGNFNWSLLLYTSAFVLAVLVAGILIFNRTERNFTDTV
jgi:lipopolysaccharide transport system permease protein